MKNLVINKAREHNLKDITVSIPKDSLIVVTGPSGSGKSSLAFDTIYIEGQRRYIESLSSYARQFLGQFNPPDVESIENLSPSIAIDQKSGSTNPRSTVGTVTEIYDYLRILFARISKIICPVSKQEVVKYTPQRIVREIVKLPLGTPIDIIVNKQIEQEELEKLGINFIRIKDKIVELAEVKKLPKKVDLVIDQLTVKSNMEERLTDSVEYALKVGEGRIIIHTPSDDLVFTQYYYSAATGKTYPDLTPKHFSFNSPLGACSKCKGIGSTNTFSPNLMITDPNLSINDGAIKPIAKKNTTYQFISRVAKDEKIDLNKPLKDLSKRELDIIFHGNLKNYHFSFKASSFSYHFNRKFRGLVGILEKRYMETTSETIKDDLTKYMEINDCPECHGSRLNELGNSCKINQLNIMEICNKSISEILDFFKNVTLDKQEAKIAEKLLKEIIKRLTFLIDVGLEYLTLNRSAVSLSGGEMQRIRLATQVGSALTGIIYVLDEPSIGLHSRDNEKLIFTLKKLRDQGNTLIVVEHDEEMIRNADYVVDLGPGQGITGGYLTFSGDFSQFIKSKSLTANYLNNLLTVPSPIKRRSSKEKIIINGVSANNIKNINVEIPLKQFVCITGVSGSGKSTLLHDVVVPGLQGKLKKISTLFDDTNYQAMIGYQGITDIINLDQSPIGRTPHSNPATYTGLFDTIRMLFAKLPEANVRGYLPGRFSFNVKGGRCEECEGNGVKKVEMHFLPDVYITCDECNGTRYNSETLKIKYKGKNIADVLDATISEALELFKNIPKANRILTVLNDIGLGHMKLGQAATTLSGGEAQRMKLARELSKKSKGHTFYVLDEPTTGLHFQDIAILLQAIHKLVDQGNSVVIIEHNLDVIKNADYVIDLGPEGGDKGGRVVFSGTPEELIETNTYTGSFLKKHLKMHMVEENN